MNKVEFVKAVAEATEKTQKEIREVLEAMQEVVFAEMANEGEIKVFDGVTLAGAHKDASVARNPQTGESVDVPEKTVPKCKFGKTIKDAINA